MRLIFFLLVLTVNSFSIDFKVKNLKYYRLSNNEIDTMATGILYRSQLNKTNEWISSEKVTSEDNRPAVYFFKFQDSPNSQILLKEEDSPFLQNSYYFAKLLQWGNDDHKSMYFVHKRKENEIFQYAEFDDSPQTLEIEDIELGGQLKHILKVHETEVDEEQKIVAIVDRRNPDKRYIPVLTDDIIDMDNIDFIHSVNSDTFNINDIWIESKNNYAVLIAFNNGIKNKIRYYQTIKNLGQKFSSIAYSINDDQYDPQFSHSGEYISFVEQDRTKDREVPLFRLYICPKPEDDIYSASLRVLGQDDYDFVDDNIWNVHTLRWPSEFSMAYSWHPKKDVLFYTKVDETSNEKWQIWYYDAENKKNKKLETETTLNYSVSISYDGKYIVFNCYNLTDKWSHFTNCILFGQENKKNDACCGDTTTSIVVVGELTL